MEPEKCSKWQRTCTKDHIQELVQPQNTNTQVRCTHLVAAGPGCEHCYELHFWAYYRQASSRTDSKVRTHRNTARTKWVQELGASTRDYAARGLLILIEAEVRAKCNHADHCTHIVGAGTGCEHKQNLVDIYKH